jgi:hypothetical protein
MGTDLLRRSGGFRWRSDYGGWSTRSGGWRPRLPAGCTELKSFSIAQTPALVSGDLDGSLFEETAKGLAIAVGAFLGICAGSIDLVDDLLGPEDLWRGPCERQGGLGDAWNGPFWARSSCDFQRPSSCWVRESSARREEIWARRRAMWVSMARGTHVGLIDGRRFPRGGDPIFDDPSPNPDARRIPHTTQPARTATTDDSDQTRPAIVHASGLLGDPGSEPRLLICAGGSLSGAQDLQCLSRRC